ncbi:GDSL-like Lipase/Acylhydrolase superfamily protein [Striga asiatica]|uniref:GDSL-like Lipase/Acylhydrolase superfamily protein n=1 Tax=Striga asiatica TaxID=4170 RepID=A0A5A7QUB4_STRAF|nr:GDSL-like Lipase/Acylhydrolase superfamily protein [Striga asiatica]
MGKGCTCSSSRRVAAVAKPMVACASRARDRRRKRAGLRAILKGSTFADEWRCLIGLLGRITNQSARERGRRARTAAAAGAAEEAGSIAETGGDGVGTGCGCIGRTGRQEKGCHR